MKRILRCDDGKRIYSYPTDFATFRGANGRRIIDMVPTLEVRHFILKRIITTFEKPHLKQMDLLALASIKRRLEHWHNHRK